MKKLSYFIGTSATQKMHKYIERSHKGSLNAENCFKKVNIEKGKARMCCKSQKAYHRQGA